MGAIGNGSPQKQSVLGFTVAMQAKSFGKGNKSKDPAPAPARQGRGLFVVG